MPKMTKELCARCDANLASFNKSPDRLCGMCQGELAPHQPNSSRYKAWVAAGKPRELHRTPSGKPKLLNPDPAPPIGQPYVSDGIRCSPLANMHAEDIIKHMEKLNNRVEACVEELRRRRADLADLARTLDEHIDANTPE